MKACYLLITTAMSIYAVAVNCGYKDEKFFARQFGEFKGCSPIRSKFAFLTTDLNLDMKSTADEMFDFFAEL